MKLLYLQRKYDTKYKVISFKYEKSLQVCVTKLVVDLKIEPFQTFFGLN